MKLTMFRSRTGYTLLEMALAMGILGIMLTVAALVSKRASDAARYTQLQTDVQARARRELDRIAVELLNAGVGQLAPDPGVLGASTFTFRSNTGIDGAGNPTWGTLTKLDLIADPSDKADGKDNDGDGLIDEKELVLTHDFGGPKQMSVVLSRDVGKLANGELANGKDDNGNGLIDEPGFVATRVGNLLTLRLTIQGRNRGGRLVQAAVETNLTLRN